MEVGLRPTNPDPEFGIWKTFKQFLAGSRRHIDNNFRVEMAEKSDMCEYELKRLQRIKSNRKMLEELFPKGTSMYLPRPIKKGRSTGRRVSVQGSQGGSASGESTPEEGTTPNKLYTLRYDYYCSFFFCLVRRSHIKLMIIYGDLKCCLDTSLVYLCC